MIEVAREKRVGNRQRQILVLSANIFCLLATIILFIDSPPAIDTYIYGSDDSNSVDVILSRVFIATILLYFISIILLMVNVRAVFKRQPLPRSITVIALRAVTLLTFIGVTFYLLGYLGYYETWDIRFMMPFRAYHPPF